MMRSFSLILITFVSNIILAQDNDLQTISNIGLKVVEITTVNQEEPTCDFVEAPEGCMGATCINSTKVPCRIIISESGNILYDSGDYIKNVSGATIKINGNTSAYYTVGKNYPYKIKLQKKSDLLFRDNDIYADKDWRLINDAISLNTIIGLKLSEIMQFPWTPKYTPCNIFINGDYRGCYLLIESVKKNNSCRIDVDDTGYIVERDPYWWSENKYFSTNYFSSDKGYRWTWKYPDDDLVTFSQEQYITDYINNAEESINNDTYEKYIDVLSFARWVLAHDILGTRDSGGSNLYVSKYDDSQNSILQIPCIWDFDSNFQMQPGQFSRIHTAAYDFYFDNLFKKNNKSFSKAYKKLWQQIYPTLLNDITSFIDEYINSEEGTALNESRKHHFKRWNYGITTIDVEEDALEAKSWFNTHLQLLNDRINIINGINNTLNNNHITVTNDYYYTINGYKTTSVNKGIYIKGRKKIFLRR